MGEKDTSSAAARNADKFVVRLPPGMRQRVAEAARANHRSMNSEIVTRLERSLDGVPAPDAEFGDPAGSALLQSSASIRLSEQEIRLVNLFRRLPDAKRIAALELLT